MRGPTPSTKPISQEIVDTDVRSHVPTLLHFILKSDLASSVLAHESLNRPQKLSVSIAAFVVCVVSILGSIVCISVTSCCQLRRAMVGKTLVLEKSFDPEKVYVAFALVITNTNRN